MVEGHRTRAWGPRILAPIAFFVAATVLILLVQSALSNDDSTAITGTSPSTVTTPAAVDTTTTRSKSGTKPKKQFYVVKPGDTLDVIAVRFHTSTDELLELNPRIDPLSLTVGQRIRVQ
ncbi:MAG TPA: LysM peptidoglycan-binding domain-containing protein [Gaiellaceae bacterium]